MSDLLRALEAFQRRYLDAHRERYGHLPRQPFDEEWPSPCQQSEPDDLGLIDWQPMHRQPPGSFANMEHALGTRLHPDICAYYSHHWRDVLGATDQRGDLNLLGAWNPRDFKRLQENLLGHLHQQKKSRVPLTLFFATCEPEDSPHFLSVDNKSGAVLLEETGRGVQDKLAASLAEFLDRLQPRLL
jgi:SecY interacting protein Syd